MIHKRSIILERLIIKDRMVLTCLTVPTSTFVLMLVKKIWESYKKNQENTPHNRAKVSKGANIRNRYNQVPHLTQDTNGKVTNSHLNRTNKSQEVSPFLAGDHKAHINRRAQRHSKRKTEKRSTKEVSHWNGQ